MLFHVLARQVGTLRTPPVRVGLFRFYPRTSRKEKITGARVPFTHGDWRTWSKPQRVSALARSEPAYDRR